MTTDSTLPYITATEAISRFRNRSLSPVELMEAVIQRAEDTNGALNCLTHEYFERALQQAREAEKTYATNPDSARPLEGVPCAIKDWHSVEGEITTYGSRLFKDFRPDQTAPAVERLLESGAIMHCRTTTPEHAHAGVTRSPLWGVTRNPWNLDYSPGGSSGGSGAAVAAGLTTIADGTDGGGSIRIPASASGIFGYKAPFGRNPTDREHPSETVLHYGPLTRSVADAALMQNVISGQHPADPHSLRDKVTIPSSFQSIKGMRVALSMDLGYFDVSAEVEAHTRALADTLESLGCIVEEIHLGWDERVFDAWLTTWEGLFWALAGDQLTDHRDELDPFVVKLIESGSQRTLKEFYGVNATRLSMYQEINKKVFDSYDVMITPTLAVPSVLADHANDDESFTIDGRPASAYLGWAMTYPFNILSTLPVASVPSGFSPTTGVPTGMQIVGKAYDDLTVFQLSAALEEATQWANRVPSL
ncbi:amidase [Rhodococcus rhodochrous]|uniref:amidase n=1 Tax=Rhodococcus rhodochrous TaxID=1829 RepID=UPI0032DF0DF8